MTNDGGVLHACQHAALLAVVAHFTASDEPAIVSLPTGAGKTELMFCVAFAFECTRILMVEPSEFLREQAKNRLEALSLFKKGTLLDPGHPCAAVREVKHVRKTLAKWEELRKCDAVSAHPKTISPGEKWVVDPPKDLFDLVLLDEAHHSAAKSWRALVRSFSAPGTRIVLFTATPFRRDRRRLPGRLVFHYPIERAVDDGIYREVEYHPVPQLDDLKRDSDLAKKTATLFNSERATNADAGLLIRTDRIEKAPDLVALYKAEGVEAVEIHTDITKTERKDRLKRLRDGEVNAVVTVGMMAEGIDVPNLKIAALHSAPQSLPYTLQLVGRISRTPATQTGPAHLVACPDQVYGEARRLFREDRGWAKFIPKLVEDAIKDAHGARANVIISQPHALSLIPEELRPFFSVEVAEFTQGKLDDSGFPLDPAEVKGLPRSVEEFLALPDVAPGCLVILSISDSTPPWAPESGLGDRVHDLHILYEPPGTGLLFMTTTSQEILGPLIEKLAPNTKRVDSRNLQGALSDAVAGSYNAVGLENALGLTGNHPSYRMHLGRGSDSSVHPSDGRIFGAGHAMGKMISGEYRGVSLNNRRIWAMKRDPVPKFIAWCNEIAKSITHPGSGLPGLSFLAEAVPARDIFKDKPIAALLSDAFISLPVDAVLSLGDEDVLRADEERVLNIQSHAPDVLKLGLPFRAGEPEINLSYSPDRNPEWEVDDKRDLQVIMPESGRQKKLADFLNENPPILLMPSGGAIRGHYGWKLVESPLQLPDDLFLVKDWTNTDIKLEAKPASGGLKNVQERTLELLKAAYATNWNNLLVIEDDAAREIADFVLVDSKDKKITFAHCKFSSKPTSGNRIADWNELFAQCARSHNWVRRSDLVMELDARIDRRKNTKILNGKRSRLTALASTYRTNEWSYHVLAVQPGCKIATLKSARKSHVYTGLHVIREWLLQANATLTVWGS